MPSQPLDLSEWTRRDRSVRDAGLALVARVERTLPVLCAIFAEHGVGEAYLFGSVARGVPRPGADVDIAVGQCPPATFYRLAAQLERALGLPLDVIDLDRAPSDMAAAIQREGQRIYPSPVAVEAPRR